MLTVINVRCGIFYIHIKNLGSNIKNNIPTKIVAKEIKIDCISRAYTYMHFVRNDLSHWDNPNKLGYDTTRQLSSQEVDRVIVDALKLIEEYYS